MIERFKFAGFILAGVLIGLPLMFLAYVLLFTSMLLCVVDLPIWLLSGKTPFCDLNKWLEHKLEL